MKNLAYDKDQLSSEKKKLQYEYDQFINLVFGHEDETNNLNGSIKKLQRDLEANNTELRDRTTKSYEKDIAEITFRAVTFEKKVQMAEQENVETVRDYKTASEE
ncbi:hypothetical protein EIN_176760 [Entamoeba invadens IP1]|uniref:hypothetical protein n=1 Tax=Entamoeba invadens IP1 TaxID=370355 RepID=UPI0002C3EB3E|nr:hypothetical protein EIN_176760 [Entamoeba invadens IP1]ELP93849.1 hypothetical protein EIN_176760 [Entamoeba invadens IP1]|eukprot:XP_004260620.1 hypothetical protein EIN_176760 [Entamoeba invadens IP1]